jgi:hypothetical protein
MAVCPAAAEREATDLAITIRLNLRVACWSAERYIQPVHVMSAQALSYA